MPPTRLPADYFPDRVPITIIDTLSRCPHPPHLGFIRSSWNNGIRVLRGWYICLFSLYPCGCSPEQKPKLIMECQAADTVVLTYACDRPATLEQLSSF
ncbi:hypothetical protein PVAP13_4NG244200 [Panicum virgatum]|uniref:Uncharacterized protein n=1 Tax=Panicum virgatum TaxID=38727 RepID=A0A8T0TAS1_PANVG|nr:hypothetical protein PVAP13_4NG244200 [Panicum virgatum]